MKSPRKLYKTTSWTEQSRIQREDKKYILIKLLICERWHDLGVVWERCSMPVFMYIALFWLCWYCCNDMSQELGKFEGKIKLVHNGIFLFQLNLV